MELAEIFYAEKVLPVEPDWKKRVGTKWLRLVCPIDIGGVTIEGLRFTVSAHSEKPDEAVAFQIEYLPPRGNVKGGPLCRLEWRPITPHNNKGLGPAEYRHRVIKTCHLHPFDLNWAEAAKHVRRGDLPIAIPLAVSPSTYEEALAFAGKEFRIKDIEGVAPPPWEARLLW